MLYLPVMPERLRVAKHFNLMSVVRIAIGAMLAIALAGCAPAMEPVAMPLVQGQVKLCSSTPEPPPKDLATNPDYVEYSVEVIDPSGAATVGLKQSDFVVANGGAPEPIAFFREDRTRPPASIGIMVDKSASMVGKLPIVKAAVAQLMKKIDPCDEVFLYAFGIDPILVQDFTTDHQLVSARLNQISAWGQTPLYDGVKMGIERLKTAHYPDKVLMIFTDDLPSGWFGSTGLDNASKNVKQDDLMSSALNSESRIYIVGVGNPNGATNVIALLAGKSQEAIDPENLKKFASAIDAETVFIFSSADENAPKVAISTHHAPGPLFFNPPMPKFSPLRIDPNQIEQVASSIASQIDDHYTIGIVAATKSPGAASTPTEMTIKIANRPAAVVRTHHVQLTPNP